MKESEKKIGDSCSDNCNYRNNYLLDSRMDESFLKNFKNFIKIEVANGDPSVETQRTYLSQIKKFLFWCNKKFVQPENANEKEIKIYRAELHESYAHATVLLKLNAVRRFYDFLIASEVRTDNPARGVNLPKNKTSLSDNVKWLSMVALGQILQAPEKDTVSGKRDRVILALMGLHGMRVSEVARLKTSDVDLILGKVNVVGKGKLKRIVILTNKSATLLTRWLSVRPKVSFDALFFDLKHKDVSKSLSCRGIRKIVDGYLVKLGLKRKGVSCHSLRHSFATLSRANGAKLDAISSALGHSSVTTTQIYADIVDKERENPANFLAFLLDDM